MNDRQPLDNAPLTAMLCTGGAMLVLGVVIRLANTDFDSYGGFDASSPVGQYFGSAIGGAGLLLLALGWTAAVICRQIADSAQPQKDRR
jgi:hypothetical protein